jgi:hypothetical protein
MSSRQTAMERSGGVNEDDAAIVAEVTLMAIRDAAFGGISGTAAFARNG